MDWDLLTAWCHPVALHACYCLLVSVAALSSVDSAICFNPLLLTRGVGHCCPPYPIVGRAHETAAVDWSGGLHFPFLVC